MNINFTQTYTKIGRFYNLSTFTTKLRKIDQEKMTALTNYFYRSQLRNFNKTHHNTTTVTSYPLLHW